LVSEVKRLRTVAQRDRSDKLIAVAAPLNVDDQAIVIDLEVPFQHGKHVALQVFHRIRGHLEPIVHQHKP